MLLEWYIIVAIKTECLFQIHVHFFSVSEGYKQRVEWIVEVGYCITSISENCIHMETTPLLVKEC